jgi:hypothetical protein
MIHGFQFLEPATETALDPRLTGSNLAKVDGFLRALKSVVQFPLEGRKEVKLRIPFQTLTTYK